MVIDRKGKRERKREIEREREWDLIKIHTRGPSLPPESSGLLWFLKFFSTPDTVGLFELPLNLFSPPVPPDKLKVIYQRWIISINKTKQNKNIIYIHFNNK